MNQTGGFFLPCLEYGIRLKGGCCLIKFQAPPTKRGLRLVAWHFVSSNTQQGVELGCLVSLTKHQQRTQEDEAGSLQAVALL